MGLLGKDSKLISDPLADNNPITIQVLGICSALAITAELKASIVMSISVIFVMGAGNVVISLIRNIIPSKIRIIGTISIAGKIKEIKDIHVAENPKPLKPLMIDATNTINKITIN